MSIKFHSTSVYDEKYIKAKIREFNAVIKANFLGDEVPKNPNITHESESELEPDIELELKPD